MKKTYGEGVFYEEAINSIYPQAVADAVEEAKLELVDRPVVDIVSISKEENVALKAVCITKPEIEVSNYKGIEVTKTVNDVTDEAINAEIEKLRQRV